jgi:CO/xanthine dehydrogenase Mo-binding subunit
VDKDDVGVAVGAELSAWPVPTATTLTLGLASASKTGKIVLSRPESWVSGGRGQDQLGRAAA